MPQNVGVFFFIAIKIILYDKCEDLASDEVPPMPIIRYICISGLEWFVFSYSSAFIHHSKKFNVIQMYYALTFHPGCRILQPTKLMVLTIYSILFQGGSLSVPDLILYYSYKYARHCVINRIWGLKQLSLQMNGHAWFHFHGSVELFRTGRQRQIQNENICLETMPRHFATGKSAL